MVLNNKVKKDIILVVDDQPNNLKVVSDVLNQEYDISIADNGKSALKILENLTPDLILLDIIMPEMDGYELCQIIKKNDKLKDIPIIFLTAKTETDDIVKGFDLGAVDYITKPFQVKEVLSRIKTHLNLYHANKIIQKQKDELELQNIELLSIKNELTKRNEDLLVAYDAIEEHAARVNKLNQLLTESEYKLKKTNEELIQINNEKDKFFSVIAHDLRSPFANIISSADLLIEKLKNKDYENMSKLVELIIRASEKALDLLTTLLTWARSQTGRLKLKMESIDLSLIVNDIINLFNDNAQRKSIKLINKVPNYIKISADKSAISTVLRNLVNNAIKFTPSNGTVEVSATANENEVIVSVKDTGIGINPENLSQIFKLDRNFVELGTDGETGTGLGLFLCKDFIEKHNGKIWVESKRGEGSTFSFSLPLK